MGVFDKIGEVAENLARGAKKALDKVMIGTHNVVQGLTGIVDKKMLEQKRAKERANRTVEYRAEKKFLQASKVYFIDAIDKVEYGPEEIRGKLKQEKIEQAARNHLIRCPECGRWFNKQYWDSQKARCRICVEEDQMIEARAVQLDSEGKAVKPELPKQRILIEEKRVPEKCPQCAYPLREAEITWVGPDKYQCPSCKSESYVEKHHREIS